MTTNVLDLQNDMATSDSRWSIDWSDAIIYVDDTGFDKIFEHNDYIFVFAGTANLIQIWKNHISDPEATGMPPTDAKNMSIAVSITDRISGDVLFEHRQAAVYETVRFAGSGATYAEQCWFRNFCPKKAVKSATHYDICSGGSVKFYSFDGEHNVDLSTTIQAIPTVMRIRGMIMYKNQKNAPILVSTAAENDPRINQLLEDLATGKESMCAPFPNMHKPMSASEKRLLEKALSRVRKPR